MTAAPLALTLGRRPDGTAVLKATGEIDLGNSGGFACALEENQGPLIVDLTDVGYLDSAGLSILFAHAAHIELITNPLLASVLSASGINEPVTIHDA